MKKILTASTNLDIIDTVKNACNLFSSFFCTDIFDSTDEIIRYIDYELPEIKVLDFTSQEIDSEKILKTIYDVPGCITAVLLLFVKTSSRLRNLSSARI